ncbi:MAG: bifunctional 3,4-dihydroxy-2-butanone-4-phosphate synthase/GTP cyclohydrolase II, partial [Chloroflexi bacterium]|nr:bifunctional 3,4-dihydroxy-2-butanone-4-phosphate synthase/GTP cyclohydrolase II [Chloroflexota bacterium]
MAFATIPEAIADIKAGKFIIIVDDENRENEGDIAIAAEKVTPEAINFMSKYARGLICMPLIGQRLDELGIPPMVQVNTSKFSTAFTVSIEAKHRTSSGISAPDRAATVKIVLDSSTKPEDIAYPGHM